MAEWQRARLIPVSGIGSEKEAEARATSALLAVIEAVRDLSASMFSPMGASKAQKAQVRCYTETPFKLGTGKTASRPDGLVQVSYGKSAWTALVEVKTGAAMLEADQINAYWDIARDQHFDAVVTISNEIAPAKDVHPTDGLKVRANSKVKVHHLSWTALLSLCEVIRDHRGVDDPDQAWILSELIRYLSHPNSGVTAFDDMGPEWVAVRDGARDAALRRADKAVHDVAQRWDQLLRFAALRLEAEIGQPVVAHLPASQREPAKRVRHLTEHLATDGQLDGALRIPNTVGDLELLVDLRARRMTAAVAVSAPEDRGGRARCTWLAGQLDGDVDARLVIDSYAKNARTPVTAGLTALRDDKDVLLGTDKREPARFRLSLTREMGVARKSGHRTPGFIDSVLDLITTFYGTVVQDLSPWTPRPPRISRDSSAAEGRPERAVDEPPLQKRSQSAAERDEPDADEVTSPPREDGSPAAGPSGEGHSDLLSGPTP